MRYQTLSYVIALSLFATTAWAQPQMSVDPRSPEEIAAERAAQLRINQPMSKFDVSQAVSYTIVSQSGEGSKTGLVYILAPEADTFEKRAHTAMKAAEDFYVETKVSPIRAYLVLMPRFILANEFHQATAIYNANERTWRAYAYDGPAIPEWKIQITEDWFDEADRVGGRQKIDMKKFSEDIGRLRDVHPDYVAPIGITEIQMKPYLVK